MIRRIGQIHIPKVTKQILLVIFLILFMLWFLGYFGSLGG